MRLFVDNHPTHKTASFHKQRKKNKVKQKSKKKQKGLRIGVARIKLLPLGHKVLISCQPPTLLKLKLLGECSLMILYLTKVNKSIYVQTPSLPKCTKQFYYTASVISSESWISTNYSHIAIILSQSFFSLQVSENWILLILSKQQQQGYLWIYIFQWQSDVVTIPYGLKNKPQHLC